MVYITAKQVSPEMALHAKKLAQEMSKLIEENFLLAPEESVHQRLQSIRSELEQMGFCVAQTMKLDLQTLKLVVCVKLYVLKESTQIS